MGVRLKPRADVPPVHDQLRKSQSHKEPHRQHTSGMITEGLPVLWATPGEYLVQLVTGSGKGREQLVSEAFPACHAHLVKEGCRGCRIDSPCLREAFQGCSVALQPTGNHALVQLSPQNQMADDVAHLPAVARTGPAPGLRGQGRAGHGVLGSPYVCPPLSACFGISRGPRSWRRPRFRSRAMSGGQHYTTAPQQPPSQ